MSTPKEYHLPSIEIREPVKMSYEKSIIPRRDTLRYYGKKTKELGKGAYGEVYMYSGGPQGNVAVKLMKSTDDNTINPANLREVSALIRMNHPNVVSIIGLHVEFLSNNIYMIMPMARTDLKKFISDRTIITPETDKFIAYQIICGVNYCLSKGIINRDIKPDNVLIYADETVKISDFGLCRSMICSFDSGITNEVYTLWYRPPEVLLGAKYGDAADIWAVGCTLFELYTSISLFPGDSEIDMIIRIGKEFGKIDVLWPEVINLPNWSPNYSTRQTKFPRLNSIKNPEALGIIKGMLAIKPSNRSRLQDVLSNTYFDTVRDNNADLNTYSCIQILEQRSSMPISGVEGQTEITRRMVTVVYDWLGFIADSLQLNRQCFYLAQLLLEKYMNVKSVRRDELQLYGSACLNVACMMIEIYSPSISDFVHLSGAAYTGNQLISATTSVISALNFDLILTTSQDFSNVYVSSGNYTRETKHVSQDLLMLLSVEPDFYFKYTPEEMAIGCLFIGCIYTKCTFKHTAHLTPKISEFVDEFVAYKRPHKTERANIFDKQFEKIKSSPSHDFATIQSKVKGRSTKVL